MRSITYTEARANLAETIDRVKRHTRRFSRRQATWFRSLSECRFVAMRADREASEVADEVARAGRQVGVTG